MVMLIVGRQSFLQRRHRLLQVFSLIGVLSLDVGVDAHRHRVLTAHSPTAGCQLGRFQFCHNSIHFLNPSPINATLT